MNPNRKTPADKFLPVVLAVVTHLPNMDGYHKDRFEVVQTCLRSMTQNAKTDFTLMVWDNDSCDVFREWIEDEIRPDVFVKSFNLGKTGGRTSLMRMIPPDRVVAYADDDMFFYPNWLQPQIDLLNHFPGVSCVTGYPVRTSFRWANELTKRWAKQNAELSQGRFIPNQWEDDFADSVGRDRETHRQGTKSDFDWKIKYNGVEAYATSHHCQFISKSEIVSRVLTYDDAAMGDEKPFDVVMDKLGLRLATCERLTRHIGNVIHDELRSEINLNLESAERSAMAEEVSDGRRN